MLLIIEAVHQAQRPKEPMHIKTIRRERHELFPCEIFLFFLSVGRKKRLDTRDLEGPEEATVAEGQTGDD